MHRRIEQHITLEPLEPVKAPNEPLENCSLKSGIYKPAGKNTYYQRRLYVHHGRVYQSLYSQLPQLLLLF